MFLSNAAVRRPIAMGALIVALLFLGANAFRGLPLEFTPRVDPPYVTILTVYPGASPETLENDVLVPLEDAISTVEGIKHVSSFAIENVATIVVEFQMHREVTEAANDLREKIELVQSSLPSGAERPKVMKVDINARPIIDLALTGDAPVDELFDYADQVLAPRLATLKGVADVQLVGGAQREVEVLLDRDRLAARGLSAAAVTQTLGASLQTLPAGRVVQAGGEFSVKFDGAFDDIALLEGLQIGGSEGTRIYLRDVGTVHMATEERRQAAYLDGKPAIAVRIVKQGEGNTVEVVNGVRRSLAELRAELPGGMQLEWVYDGGGFIGASVDSALSSILQAIGLTALILLLFLADLRTTIIASVTMPVTYVVSMFFLRMMDFSLNIATLLAIGLSVGVLVTNSIVVLERIVKRLDEGLAPKEAARLGTADVVIAVLASAGTNIVVLFPVSVMPGLVGKMLAPFATTLIVVTAVSLFLSFTLTPLLAALLLRARDPGGQTNLLGRAVQLQERALSSLSQRYADFVQWLGAHRGASVGLLAGVVLALVVSGLLARGLSSGMMPASDRGMIKVRLELASRADLATTTARVKEAEALLAGLPHLEKVYTTVGKVEAMMGGASEGVHLGQILLVFNERTQRDLTVTEIIGLARARLAALPGVLATVTAPGPMGDSGAQLELQVMGADFTVLDRLARQIEGVARRAPDLVDVDTTVREGKPELRVVPRRAVLADLHLPVAALGPMIRANLAGLVAGTFQKDGRTYDIRVKLAQQEGTRQVAEFLLPGKPGQPMLLDAVAEVREGLAPLQINRVDKRRISRVYANPAPGAALGGVTFNLKEAIRSQVELPPGYHTRPAGMVEILEESNREMGQAMLIALVLTVLLLAAVMESLRRPILVLVTIPLAFIGVLAALLITGEMMSIFVMLGSVMLVGIVVNNAILVMDEVGTRTAAGAGPHEAMVEASRHQLRPILMITLAAVLGMLPLALGQGLGAEPRVGIGWASIGGILVSGALTLFVLPAMYMLFTRSTPGGAPAAAPEGHGPGGEEV